MAKPHSVKAQPHWLSAFNNEVCAGTISPLCHTRTDPWGDFLVVMVLIRQSLPQRPGSIELHYNTHTHWGWLNKAACWAHFKRLTHFQLHWNDTLKMYLIIWWGSRPLPCLAPITALAFIWLTGSVAGRFLYNNHSATNCEIIGPLSKQNEDCKITANYETLFNDAFTLRSIDR